MKLLGLDIEIGNPFTLEDGFTSWPREEAWITEIACVLYDTEMGEAPVRSFETLVNEGKGVSPEAEQYTGISNALIEKYGADPKSTALKVLDMITDADYVVAQNGNEADRPWLKAFLLRYLGKEMLSNFTYPEWLDTLTDIEYPENCRSKNLTYLNGFHGFCNPFPHRAGSDVQSMMKVLFNYPLDRVIEVSKSPWVYLKAIGPCDHITDYNARKPYFDKTTQEGQEMERWKKQVKAARFRWDGDAENTGQKCWYKKTKQIWIDEGKEDHGFEYVRLDI
jgi:hypothetical protein